MVKLTKMEYKRINQRDPKRALKICEVIEEKGFPVTILYHGGFQLEGVEVIKLWYIIGYSKDMKKDLEKFCAKVAWNNTKDDISKPFRLKPSDN